MAVVVLIPTRQNDSQTASVDIPAGSPAYVQIAMDSAVFGTDPTLTFSMQADQSFDGGTTFEPWFGTASNGGTAGTVYKGVVSDGLPKTTVSFDGQPRTCRVSLTVNQKFSWGLTAEVFTV